MQYPYAVSFVDEDDGMHQYVVRANDSGQAVRRARRKLETDPKTPRVAAGKAARVMNLTPKQDGGRYLPRIDGSVLPVQPCDDEDTAVQAAVKFANAGKGVR